MQNFLKAFFFIFMALPGSISFAESFEIPHLKEDWKIDGRLDEPAWSQALQIELLYEWFPGDGITPPVQTTTLLAFDPQHLYIAFRCQDPAPDSIRAHYMDRDEINTFVQDDHVSVMIDTFNDERRAFQFRVNPLGVQADALFSENEGIEDFSWDMIWNSAGTIQDDGYVVEIALPMNQLRFPSTQGPQTWGIELGRSYPRSVRHRIAAIKRDRNRNCLLCQLNKITGLQNLKQGKGLEIVPTLTAGRLDELNSFPDGELQSGDEDFELGLNTRWSITSGLTLNVAVNPDFSQVEADAAQLSVNERFALFFPEKRPFFLEGSDVLATPIRAVFTRTVADPDVGVKFSGKQNRHAIGMFVARDDTPPALILPSNQSSSFAVLPDDKLDSGVFRYRFDAGANSTIGALVTHREGDQYHNTVGGVDGFFRIGNRQSLSFQALASDTQYPDSFGSVQSNLTPSDSAWFVNYAYQDRHWSGNVTLESIGNEFRADAGFVPRVDVQAGSVFGSRTWWAEPGATWSQKRLGTFFERRETEDGNLGDQTKTLFFNIQGPWQSFVELAVEENDFAFGTEEFRDLFVKALFARVQPTGKFRTSLFIQDGETVDFTNVQPAEFIRISPSAELRLGKHLNLKLNHTRQTLDTPEDELFQVDLSEIKVVYQFNTRAFVRAIFQFQDLKRNLEQYDVCVADPANCPFAEREKDQFLQVLGSYKLNPQTVIFLGYNENLADVQSLGGPPMTSPDLVRTDRFFFLKIGYAWTL